MTLSELIAAYGDDKVSFQKIDDCASHLNMTNRGTTLTISTPETMSFDGMEKLGLLVWLDRKRVAEIIDSARKGTDNE